MSIPDGLQYLNLEVKSFTRESEYETIPSFYEESCGVWLDEFNGHWVNKKTIEEHLKNNKKICIVSPDLHKRPCKAEWEDYKNIEKELRVNDMMICTDYPEEARDFFNE